MFHPGWRCSFCMLSLALSHSKKNMIIGRTLRWRLFQSATFGGLSDGTCLTMNSAICLSSSSVYAFGCGREPDLPARTCEDCDRGVAARRNSSMSGKSVERYLSLCQIVYQLEPDLSGCFRQLLHSRGLVTHISTKRCKVFAIGYISLRDIVHDKPS
jgi:hypothetical protein